MNFTFSSRRFANIINFFLVSKEGMSLKSLFFYFLVTAIVAAPMAEAQQGIISGLLGLIRIQGQLFCTINGTMGVNGTATPVFPNALVRLQCDEGNVASTATTNGSGIFSIVLDPAKFLLSSLLSNYSLAVSTPLSTCNADLPSAGGLLSSLQFVGNTLLGFLDIANIVPSGFHFLPNL